MNLKICHSSLNKLLVEIIFTFIFSWMNFKDSLYYNENFFREFSQNKIKKQIFFNKNRYKNLREKD